MRLSKFVPLAAVFLLAACEEGEDINGFKNIVFHENADPVAVSYEYGGRFEVNEFRSSVDPSRIVVVVEGSGASGIASWEDRGATLSDPVFYSEFNPGDDDLVYEFSPASDPDMHCIYTDGSDSGALTCHPMNPAARLNL